MAFTGDYQPKAGHHPDELSIQFRRWVYDTTGLNSNTVQISRDSLRYRLKAHFEMFALGATGKKKVYDSHKTLEELLQVERNLTAYKRDACGADFMLEEVVKAIKAYKGTEDTTPLEHELRDEKGEMIGYHVR